MEVLRRSLAFAISLLITTLAVAGGVQFSYKTVDDAKIVEEIVYQESNSQVLGASTENSKDSKCPSTSPIIGWINYRGKKTIQ